MIEKIIGSLIIGVIGVVTLMKPKIIWELQKFGFIENGEPTEFAIIFIRCFGLFEMGVAIYILFN